MKLQLALDRMTLEESLALLRQTAGWVDIIEVGTPLILREGLAAVRAIRSQHPHHTVLADIKIMDAGDFESSLAFEAGADIVTVMAATGDSTIRSCVEAAARYGKQVLADLVNIQDIPGRIARLEELGVDYVCVHTAVDEQASGKSPWNELETAVHSAKKAMVSVAGGIKPSTIRKAVDCAPEVVIVGGAVACAPDPREAVRILKEALPL